MAQHDWGRLIIAGQLADGPCIWCGLAKSEVASEECPKHPRGTDRPIPTSIVDDPIAERLAEIRKNEGRMGEPVAWTYDNAAAMRSRAEVIKQVINDDPLPALRRTRYRYMRLPLQGQPLAAKEYWGDRVVVTDAGPPITIKGEVPHASCYCPAKPGEDCPLTIVQCIERLYAGVPLPVSGG